MLWCGTKCAAPLDEGQHSLPLLPFSLHHHFNSQIHVDTTLCFSFLYLAGFEVLLVVFFLSLNYIFEQNDVMRTKINDPNW